MSNGSPPTGNLSFEEKRALLARLLVQKAGAPKRFPLSFGQQRLWFLHQMEPDSSAYNLVIAVRLSGSLDIGALEQTLREIVRRHEVLRTTFAVEDGQPVQVITPEGAVRDGGTVRDSGAVREPPLQVVDMQAVPAAERETETRRLAMEETDRPFDLAHGPLLRATLFHLAEADYVLLLTMHHIISDGWSTGVLIREVAALYATSLSAQQSALSAPLSAQLSALPIQYADFAVWQRNWFQGDVQEAQLAYWKAKLVGAPATLDLPLDRPRPPLQTFRGASQSFALPASLAAAIRTLNHREGVTLFMTLLAAFDVLLARYSGRDDIVVGSPIAGRHHGETEALIGFFINSLVLRCDLSGNPTFHELLGRVRETALDAYAHQDTPFEKLVEVLQPERDLSQTPLFQVMFILQNAPLPPLELPDLTVQLFDMSDERAQFDLTLTLFESDDTIMGTLAYNIDLFEAATIARMVGHFQFLLEQVVADPERRLSDVALLSEVERRQVLVEWNDTTTAYPLDTPLHTLIAAQATRTPDAVALAFDHREQRTKNKEPRTKNQEPRADGDATRNTQHATRNTQHATPFDTAQGRRNTQQFSQFSYVTYRELDQRANQLAHELRARGVGREVRVGICLERSTELLIALLGVLKAGGAYVPLDPAFPAERLQFMLADAQVALLLTSREIGEWRLEIDAAGQSPISILQSQIIHLDAEWETIARQPTHEPDSDVTGEDLAYVIYTSGSTGKPKGVMVRHRGLTNFLCAMSEQPGLTADDTLLAVTTLSFDIAGLELYLPLLVGARLVLAAQPRTRATRSYSSSACARVARRCSRPLRPPGGCCWPMAGPATRSSPRCAAAKRSRPTWPPSFSPAPKRSGTSTAPPRPRSGPPASSSAPRRCWVSAAPSPTPRSICSTGTCIWCRLACRASCTSAGRAWRAATSIALS